MPAKGASTYPCPACGQFKATVVDSRWQAEARTRRRLCRNCGERWSTIEIDMAAGRALQKFVKRFRAALSGVDDIRGMLDELAQNPLVKGVDDE